MIVFEIIEFKEMFMQIISDGSKLAIIMAVAEKGINMMVSFVIGNERIRF